ncbi:RNA polymerase sigma factor SigX [Rossellomorea marisflavi]|uniref:RNA polymerase sigma factor SigX n=1 Tax=Rossellomorea TaxID=2837508 RepID=UPI00064E206D|nr:RNA polymerase sigma factor SigX [Rossellomorea marisflavi]KMK93639.1 RNA polymerase sigma factor SigX [Rossellomorea marisflavi]KML01424.1 RNA polymerase sigma factor SigX [Rossellomorea marisflavi]KML34850.1 RNA polymerase sigma factor SigX [Rossellomorea marisflavi]MCM2605057.1 RNA polymerase sigma factor SigX [Rossellomorea marisflavi]QHA36773.1 RNA polymerase sigma factor SigX [Rossellomorea marisflavi]
MHSVFEDMYKKYHQDVFQFLLYMVQNRQLAEDLVQEVYIRVLKSHQHFEGKSSERTWLFSIAKNVAIDHFRKQKNWKNRLLDKFDWNRSELSDENPLPEELALANEEVRELYDCLKCCSTDHRMVIIMRYLQELSIVETAEILNWSESKVKTTQHRAVKWLRIEMNKRLRKEGDDSEAI